jgi:phosphatidylinositol alpha-1,6-mannosyltransferase
LNSLLLTPELFATEGGIARILRLYLKALCELSLDNGGVRLLSLNDNVVDSSELRSYSNESLVEWEVCGRRKLRFCFAALRMSRKSDRVICGHVAQLPVVWLASILNPRFSYYLVAHGIEVWRPFTFLERLALRGAKGIFCVSDYTRRQLLEHCALPPGRASVLHNALDPYLDPGSPTMASKGPPVILTISRLSASDNYKGIGHLIAAMPAVRKTMPDATLRIVGRGDGLKELQSLSRRLMIDDAVVFAGYLSDTEIKAELERCRLFALPSQKEGFGLVYLEAMAHGRPCLAARSGGSPEVITEETGVLVEYGDVPAIGTAIVEALRRDWKAAAIIERARDFSYSKFKDHLASLLAPGGTVEASPRDADFSPGLH